MFSKSERRFGIELEYNAFDGQSRSKAENELPSGIYELANALVKSTNLSVEINKWSYTNNNDRWVLKPDSSCGIEVCSPPMRGKNGCFNFYETLKSFVNHPDVEADGRCSMHVHIEIEDFAQTEIAYLISKWIQCEPLFFIITDKDRWINQYCIPLGLSHTFDDEEPIQIFSAIEKLSQYKYYAINFYHYIKNRKKTVEFRCMGNDACVIPEDAYNWLKLIICFVDRCKGTSLFDPIRPEYRKISEIVDLLDIVDYFDEDEIIIWLISKLSRVLHDNLQSQHYWQAYVNFSREDIIYTIEKLEAYLL